MTETLRIAIYDDSEISCPKLGGQIRFEYCRIEDKGRPCSQAIDCWSPYFDAEKFFRGIMSYEGYVHCFCQPPKPRLTVLLELIEQAKKTAEKLKKSTGD